MKCLKNAKRLELEIQIIS